MEKLPIVPVARKTRPEDSARPGDAALEHIGRNIISRSDEKSVLAVKIRYLMVKVGTRYSGRALGASTPVRNEAGVRVSGNVASARGADNFRLV